MRKKIVLIATITILLISSLFCGCDIKIETQTVTEGNAVSYELLNRITLEKTSANLAVYATDNSSKTEYTGSGVIIKSVKKEVGLIVKTNEYTFYFLTNNHVVCGGKKGLEYKVTDYLERTFPAQIINCSAGYDLALLKFTVDESDLILKRDGEEEVITPTVIDFAENSDLKNGDIVFAVGQPHKQRNAITIGKFLYKSKVGSTNNVYSMVDFDVLLTDAYTTNGSSGGMMLDSNLKLVGVVFGGIFSTEPKKFERSCAIPIERVKEFIDSCNLELETDNSVDKTDDATGKVA